MAPVTMPESASPVDVSLRLRERGWTPYKVYFDGYSQAWIAVVIDWKRAEHGSFMVVRALRTASTEKNLTELHTTNLSRRTSVAFACF